jgi:hypothetical protein
VGAGLAEERLRTGWENGKGVTKKHLFYIPSSIFTTGNLSVNLMRAGKAVIWTNQDRLALQSSTDAMILPG